MHGWIGAQHVTWWPTYTTGEPRREEEEHAAEHPPPGSGAPSAGDLRVELHPAPCNEAEEEETPRSEQAEVEPHPHRMAGWEVHRVISPSVVRRSGRQSP